MSADILLLPGSMTCFVTSRIITNNYQGCLYKQSMEFSGSIPRGGAFPGRQDGGSMEFEAGSTFSVSSIRSAQASQFMWNLVTRGFDARIFLWSLKTHTKIGLANV